VRQDEPTAFVLCNLGMTARHPVLIDAKIAVIRPADQRSLTERVRLIDHGA
jgi:hypothetical protein